MAKAIGLNSESYFHNPDEYIWYTVPSTPTKIKGKILKKRKRKRNKIIRTTPKNIVLQGCVSTNIGTNTPRMEINF